MANHAEPAGRHRTRAARYVLPVGAAAGAMRQLGEWLVRWRGHQHGRVPVGRPLTFT
jgi:hypothetical protein